MICNCEDEHVLAAFLRAIKARLPADMTYSASHIMTDDTLMPVFGPAVKRLFNISTRFGNFCAINAAYIVKILINISA